MGLFDSLSSVFKAPKSKNDKLFGQTTKDMAQQLPNIYNKPFQAYGGDWTAPSNQYQDTAIASMNDILSQYGGEAPKLADHMGDYFNPYLEKVGANTVRDMNQFAFDQQSDWARGAHMAGAYGDKGYGVGAGEIAGKTAQATGDRLDQIYASGWDKAMQAAGIDVGNVMQNRTQGMNAAQNLYAAGTQQQSQAQAQLDALFAEFMRGQNDPERRMLIASQIMNLLKGPPQDPAQSPFMEGLGAAASLGGTFVKASGWGGPSPSTPT